MTRFRSLGIATAGILIALSLAACTSTPMPVPTASPTSTPQGDGVLRIGTEFPKTGASAFIGPAQADGVALALADINAAGGVLGKPAQVLQGDSGDATTTTMESSFATLVSGGADALIGPSSSVLVQRLLPKAVAAGIPMISPAATAPGLTTLDDSNYAFRTISSDALEGTALAQVLSATQGIKVGLIYFDDDSGNAIDSTLAANLKKDGGTLVVAQKMSAATTDLASVVSAVTASKPDVVVLANPFSAMAQNTALITQLSAAGLGGAKLWLTSGDMADYSQALGAGVLTGVNGILQGTVDTAFDARVKALDPSILDYSYAAEAYDAAILTALAATVAHSDSGEQIASALQSVSQGGIKCTSYAECLEVLKTQKNIDYDGVSGPISLSDQGDPQFGHFGIYKYTADNKFAWQSQVLAG